VGGGRVMPRDGSHPPPQPSPPRGEGERRGSARGLFLRLAVQNLARRPARTAVLAAAVALGGGAAFATATLLVAVRASMAAGADRLGADLALVPRDTLVNLTAALLTVEPSPHTLDATRADAVAALPGVARVAPQRAVRLPLDEAGHRHDVAVVAFDPARDFTVLPWLAAPLPRPLGPADVLVGARRPEQPGRPLELAGRTLTVAGRLERTGVGAFDHAVFVTFGAGLGDATRASALLVRLEPGTGPERLRFALAAEADLKVVGGDALDTSVAHGFTALAGGLAAVAGLVLAGWAVLLGLVFSAVIDERRAELGLLLALGVRPGQVVRLVALEAALVTGLGAAAGVLAGAAVLLAVRRSLGHRLEELGVPLAWPPPGAVIAAAAGCVLLAALVGVLGAAVPAWRAARREPDVLVRGGA
jgi:putative ABC transport system permease protein